MTDNQDQRSKARWTLTFSSSGQQWELTSPTGVNPLPKHLTGITIKLELNEAPKFTYDGLLLTR